MFCLWPHIHWSLILLNIIFLINIYIFRNEATLENIRKQVVTIFFCKSSVKPSKINGALKISSQWQHFTLCKPYMI